MTLEELVAVQDCGLIINMKLTESQVFGVIMGITSALYEEAVYDAKTGRMLKADMEFYRLAGIKDVGKLRVHMMTTEAHEKRGVIGIGEPPVISRRRRSRTPSQMRSACACRTCRTHPTASSPLCKRKDCSYESIRIRRAKNIEGSRRPARQAWGQTEILAGGTDLVTALKQGLTAPTRVVSLRNKELRGIEDGRQGLRIGSMTTLGEIAENKKVKELFPSIVTAITGIGSPQILSAGTLGGDLCQRPRCVLSQWPRLVRQAGRHVVGARRRQPLSCHFRH